MKNRKVKIEANADAAGGVDFEVDGIKAMQSRVKLDKDSGEHRIEFELHDRSGRGLEFDQADPIWVDEDAPCPPTPGISTDQLAVIGREARRLTMVNQNSGRARQLRYQLNFIAADGSRAECDPIVDNGGGTRSFD